MAEEAAPPSEALAQAGGALAYGFVATGFPVTGALNVEYEPCGVFDGSPLYREVGGGRAAMYWSQRDRQWKLHPGFTEEQAKQNMSAARLDSRGVGSNAVPLGSNGAETYRDGGWHRTTVRLTARAPPSPPVPFSISEMTGKRIADELSLDACVGTMQQIIWSKTGTEPFRQRLMMDTKQLLDGRKTLREEGAHEGSAVTVVTRTAEEALRELAEREEQRQAASEAEAKAQAMGELRRGFKATDFPWTSGLNGTYKPRGQYNGFPLYTMSGGPAAYWDSDPRFMQWQFHSRWTRQKAQEHKSSANIVPDGGGMMLPMGTHAFRCFLDGAFKPVNVTLTPVEPCLDLDCCSARPSE